MGIFTVCYLMLGVFQTIIFNEINEMKWFERLLSLFFWPVLVVCVALIYMMTMEKGD